MKIKSSSLLTLLTAVLLMLSNCATYENPFDPEGDNPKPLAPHNISITKTNDDEIRISFQYEYASDSKILIKRDERTIAVMRSGHKFFDYWTITEDAAKNYQLIGQNDFGSTGAPKCGFRNKIPPRVTFLSSINDTVKSDTKILFGTVWDPSDVEVLLIDLDTVLLNNTQTISKYNWYYSLKLDEGKNQIRLYTQDKSDCESDTTIQFEVYYKKD